MKKQFYHFLSITLSLMSFPLYAGDALLDDIIEGPNEVKRVISEYMHADQLKQQLYQEDQIDRGSAGVISRRYFEKIDLREGSNIVVIRYGNTRADEKNKFPDPLRLKRFIDKRIAEELALNGIDPSNPNLTEEDITYMNEIIEDIRQEMGYTVEEQQQKIQQAQEKKGAPLSPSETDHIKNSYPVIPDPQVDELEALILVDSPDLYKLHQIFMDQNTYSSTEDPDNDLSYYFKKSHILTPEELSERNISRREGENLFYAHLKLGQQPIIEYTVKNMWRKSAHEVTLQPGDRKALIPVLTTAWMVSDPFFSDNEKQYRNKVVDLMSGYLILEPYIEKDDKGYQSVSKTHIIATYRKYIRVNEKEKPMGDLNHEMKEVRLAEAKSLIKKMMSKFYKQLKDPSH